MNFMNTELGFYINPLLLRQGVRPDTSPCEPRSGSTRGPVKMAWSLVQARNGGSMPFARARQGCEIRIHRHELHDVLITDSRILHDSAWRFPGDVSGGTDLSEEVHQARATSPFLVVLSFRFELALRDRESKHLTGRRQTPRISSKYEGHRLCFFSRPKTRGC
jgi:hypothetical protein